MSRREASIEGGPLVALGDLFRRFSGAVAKVTASPYAFVAALGSIAAWAATGRRFGYSDTWQLVINTGTTIVNFLMAFVLQNTQEHGMRALHLKVDGLILASKTHNRFIGLEEFDDAEVEAAAAWIRDGRNRAGAAEGA